MINLLKKLLICSLCLIGWSAQALTLSAKLTGEELFWQNGMRVSSYLTSTNWQVMGGLAPTMEWSPGTFMSTSVDPGTDDVVLKDTLGNEVTVQLEVSGMQYGLGAAADKFSRQKNSTRGSGTIGTCPQYQLQPSVAFAIGSDCEAGLTYQSTVPFTPFQFARPLITLSDAALTRAFTEAKVPQGTYSGHVMVAPFYMYRSQGGAWTYRQFGPVPVTLQIHYIPALLRDVTIIGSGEMIPHYDTTNHSVSGEAQFEVIAQGGGLTSGLKLTFEHDGDGAFELKHSDTLLNSVIPYSLRCKKCDTPDIITDGVLNVSSDGTIVSGGSERSLVFQLVASFEAQVDDVETGLYSDKVVVIFEENL
ncbi:hypothetical protein HAS15_21560 [Vibrio campbellii]|nr:hypothetical protein [Vibrio campbellii]MBT0143927.1 hypothetical protein [Vibrio campbellii]MBT0182294.1 hypothetical protein [Vibrio campbellii]MBT0191571.1 hypothetical protein [Vibrio campbellii]MBT0201088.1 hypothetical protein [Vibrio campbellii]